MAFREAGLEVGREPLPAALGASPGFGVLAGGLELSAAPAPAPTPALGPDADVAASPPAPGPPERLPLRGRDAGGAPPAVAASCSTSAFRSCASFCFCRVSSTVHMRTVVVHMERSSGQAFTAITSSQSSWGLLTDIR